MIFVIFLYAGFLTFTNVKHDAFNDEMNAVSTQWTMQDGSRVDIQNLPKLNDKWDSYVLSNTLPKNIKEGDSLNFYSYNSSFKVEINGRKVYHYTVKENITGHCDGDVIHSIGLSANDSGGEIVITATPAEDYEYAEAPTGWTAGQDGEITIEVSEAGTVAIPAPTAKQQSEYPSYIDENVAYKSAYDTWKTNNNVAAGDNKYEAAFLLNIAPGAEDQTLEPASITIADGKVVITANKNLGTVNGKVYVKTATTLAGLKTAEWVAATLDDDKAINVTPDSTDEAGFYQIKVDF